MGGLGGGCLLDDYVFLEGDRGELVGVCFHVSSSLLMVVLVLGMVMMMVDSDMSVSAGVSAVVMGLSRAGS